MVNLVWGQEGIDGWGHLICFLLVLHTEITTQCVHDCCSAVVALVAFSFQRFEHKNLAGNEDGGQRKSKKSNNKEGMTVHKSKKRK